MVYINYKDKLYNNDNDNDNNHNDDNHSNYNDDDSKNASQQIISQGSKSERLIKLSRKRCNKIYKNILKKNPILQTPK